MKKTLTLTFIVGYLLASPFVFAEGEAESPKPMSAEDMKKWEESFKKQQLKAKELEGSEWDVQLSYTDDKKKKTEEKDRLVFKGGTVKLESFAKKGYPTVGYTVIPNEEGEGASWENFQVTTDGSLAMKGIWDGDSMTGGVTEAYDKGKKARSYSFSSKKTVSAADRPAGVPASEAVTPAAASTDSGSGKLVSLETAS